MQALSMVDGHSVLNADRCIGCGLCVMTCPSGALTLQRKPPEIQPVVPKNQKEAFLLRARMRAEVRQEMDDKLSRHKKLP
jgi:Fe-S-cluster-containing hydrogenase component 2